MSSPSVPRAVMRHSSQKFCAAVRSLHTPPTSAGPVRISDERIGEEPNCYWKLAGTLEPDLWIWNPDLLQAGSMIPVYRLQGRGHER